MKRLLLFLILSQLFTVSAFADAVPSDTLLTARKYKNSVYLEAGGNGLIGSLNYERVFQLSHPKQSLAIRVGGFFIPSGRVSGILEYEAVFPVEFSLISGSRAVKFEAGVGLSVYTNQDVYHVFYNSEVVKDKAYWLFPVLRVGGRWEPAGKRFLLKAGFTPIVVGDYFSIPVFPWVGISGGYRF